MLKYFLKGCAVISLSLLLAGNNSWAGIDFVGGLDTDGCACGDTTTMDGATSATFAAVIKFSLIDNAAVIEKFDNSASQSFIFQINDDHIRACIFAAEGGNTQHWSNDAVMSIDTLYVVMAVWSGGYNWAFYINGSDAGNQLDTDSGTVTSIADSAVEMSIGNEYNLGVFRTNRNPNGIIYQIDTWKNKAFTAAEAAQYANAKLKNIGMTQGATMSFWLDDQPSGVTINTLTFKDAITGITCTGSDIDGNSLTTPETVLNYPAGIID